ncbi:P-loop containing nucleoside triphosphate hydrolase protein [Annulohypoxylon stygium]|nr:P-loop containing nucleoside triphosphate hydrolase protein [Annulohypoxylon stygium]
MNESTGKYMLMANPPARQIQPPAEIPTATSGQPYPISDALKSFLAGFLSDYPGVEIWAPVLNFTPPFLPFLHRWESFVEKEKTVTDETLRTQVQYLMGTLERELEGSFKALHGLNKTGYIDYKNILIPFTKGEIVLRSDGDVFTAAILEDAQVASQFRYCHLNVWLYTWDGSSFGFESKTWVIDSFDGYRKVVDLAAFPLKFHPNREEIRQSLIKRGRSFESLCSSRHIMQYDGLVDGRRVKLSDRIIVDAGAYYRFQRLPTPILRVAATEKSEILSATKRADVPLHRPALSEEQCLVTPPYVKGFALSKKEFFEFSVDSISRTVWNDRLLENLVIDEEQKDMLLGHGFDDFLEGKGKGVVTLLAGPPGVGKTLTVESVAEALKRPLYKISAADLGTKSNNVEHALKCAFDRCSHWGAVLLIDEADIFLESRSSNSLSRNELVTIFLTMLEYYQGVLMLTTNRTRGIDPAFESRIDIILTTGNLSQDARRKIWSNFIKTLPSESVDLSLSDFDSLSKWLVNGRQIKTAVKTAWIIATMKQEPVRLCHLETVLEVRKKGSKLIDMQDGQWDVMKD